MPSSASRVAPEQNVTASIDKLTAPPAESGVQLVCQGAGAQLVCQISSHLRFHRVRPAMTRVNWGQVYTSDKALDKSGWTREADRNGTTLEIGD